MEKTYKISGMSCRHCIMAIENELKNAGFEKFEVKIGSAKVEYDGKEETENKIISAVKEAGYEVVNG